jgi:uncharacterized protein DUF5990
MEIVVRGRRPPGRRFGPYENVHVALQVRSQPMGLVPGDTENPEWSAEVEVVPRDGELDFRGPAVHGRRGERFLYLTWGEVRGDRFDMFRRAKLILADCGADGSTAHLVAEVDLSDDQGGPRCARVRPPAVRWSSGPAT